ncbi:MAG: DUF3604 domain-containing protein [Candidatus Solibacter usitatus]|nr:DUF3604 domain-containing protein [Candidatus Solibacter usitatus]
MNRLAASAVVALCLIAFQSGPTPRRSEADATRRAEALDLGSVTMEGPAEAVADSLVNLKFRFTVGKAGMKTGGGIRLASAHGLGAEWGGNRLQTQDPLAENYLAAPAEFAWTSHQGVQNPLFKRYHPWQNIHQFLLTGAAHKPGDVVEIALHGVRLQRWDEAAFTLKFYVDPFGNDDYLPLPRNPSFRIVGAAAAPDWIAGRPGWVHVWIGDAFGNPATGFRGVITSGYGEHVFRAGDGGVHRFENVVLPNPGVYRIGVREKNGQLQGQSSPIVVRDAAPQEKLYWGDIHTHTMYSDGRGAPDETYAFGRNVAALDFAAVTDHSFITEDWMWDEIRKTTQRYYEPGRYVTFLAYEWSGQTDVGGDHNVYTSDPDLPLIRCYSYYNYENLRMYHGPRKGANHVEDLFRMLAGQYRNENILVIPHFGGRQGNPAWHNPELQRQIEIFSDHRRSEDWANKFLEKGYRVGIMASTDNHAGNAGYGVRRRQVVAGEEGEVYSRTSPMERGTALVAAYASELTRDGIFQALYHRRTYATTGSRIVLRFEVNGALMGSEIRAGGPPRITAWAEGTAPIRTLRVVKNGRVVYSIAPQALGAKLEYTDLSGDYQNRFYYLDLVQEDGEKAISSPVWVN